MVDLADPRIFEAVVDCLETGVYLVDRNRKIVYWNRGAERISGYKRHDVTGRFCRDKISLEGHPDARPYPGGSDYSHWELSVDRANAARRLMQQNGVGAGQVVQVRGYADQRLRKPNNPEDASNRRISLIVQYMVKENESGKESSDTKSKESTLPKEGASPNEEH